MPAPRGCGRQTTSTATSLSRRRPTTAATTSSSPPRAGTTKYADPDSHTDEINGSGRTDNDISPFTDTDAGTGSAQTQHSVRSERSGRGNGRTYTITYEAQFGDGNLCMGEFTIEVPHDMGRGAENKNVHEPGG